MERKFDFLKVWGYLSFMFFVISTVWYVLESSLYEYDRTEFFKFDIFFYIIGIIASCYLINTNNKILGKLFPVLVLMMGGLRIGYMWSFVGGFDPWELILEGIAPIIPYIVIAICWIMRYNKERLCLKISIVMTFLLVLFKGFMLFLGTAFYSNFYVFSEGIIFDCALLVYFCYELYMNQELKNEGDESENAPDFSLKNCKKMLDKSWVSVYNESRR